MTGTTELLALRELVAENRRQCDHGKQNLTQQISLLSQSMGRHQKAQEIMEVNIAKLDTKLSTNFHEISSNLTNLQIKMAENGVSHKTNGYMIKWLMGICATLFASSIGMFGALIIRLVAG